MIAPPKNFIRVASDNWTLEESLTGKPFTPIGCNYYDPHTGWPPQFWTRFKRSSVKRHFRMMEDLNMNAIRVWLQWSIFMPERGKLSERALDQCFDLLSTAKAAGIRVNLTGPEFWEGYPRWMLPQDFQGYRQFVDPAYGDAHKTFWELFAERVAQEETIYGFDLANEPFMPWDGRRLRILWNRWLKERYGSVRALRRMWRNNVPATLQWGRIPPPPNCKIPGSRYLLDYQTFREEKALEWIRNTVRAIRSVDPNHLITVGLHQSGFPLEEIIPSRYTAFNPHLLGECLDYVALHWYSFGNPLTASIQPFDLPQNMEKSLSIFLANCRYSHVGKPLVMEECSYYGGGAPTFWGGVLPYRTEKQQVEFSLRFFEVGQGSLCGWLNWPLQDTPTAADTSAYGGLYSATGKRKTWGELFGRIARKYHAKRLTRCEARTLIPVSRVTLLTDGIACDRILMKCHTLFTKGKDFDFEIRESKH